MHPPPFKTHPISTNFIKNAPPAWCYQDLLPLNHNGWEKGCMKPVILLANWTRSNLHLSLSHLLSHLVTWVCHAKAYLVQVLLWAQVGQVTKIPCLIIPIDVYGAIWYNIQGVFSTASGALVVGGVRDIYILLLESPCSSVPPSPKKIASY